MNILILSLYYPPDLSAGSFRVVALVKELEKLQKDLKITVLTAQPNRYNNLADEVAEIEHIGNVTVRRISIPTHSSGVVGQARAYVTFARKARAFAEGNSWNVVFATSSRLMTAYLGARISRSTNTPLYLDIRDLFVDTIKDVFNPLLISVVLPIVKVMEKYTFRSAVKLNVVSKGFIPHVDMVAPLVEKVVLTNGVDEEFFVFESASNVKRDKGKPYVILYAGNVGEGQGLHTVLPAAAKKLGNKICFKIIGSGGRIEQLKKSAAELQHEANASSIEIESPVPRSELIEEYKNADILFVHLNDYEAFKKVLPSKIFEYAASGKPMVAGVAGYAAEFIESEVDGAKVFSPCDSEGLAIAVEETLENLQTFNRSAFCEKYARKSIMKKLAKDILSIAK